MSEYIGKRIVPKHCGEWSSGTAYEVLSIILDKSTGDSYIAKKEVPAGTELTDTEYWALCSQFSGQMEKIKDGLTDAEKDIDLLNTRLDANVTASTDADADYAAEVVDARVDSEGETYASIGNAIRSATDGLPVKINPSQIRTAVLSSSGNTAEVSLKNHTVYAQYSHTGTSYVGIFAGFFGEYEDAKEKKYRIVLKSDHEDLKMAVLVTNAPNAWGGSTTGAVSLGVVELNEANGYVTSIDVDLSGDEIAALAAKDPDKTELFFALRDEYKTVVESCSFLFYAYELTSKYDEDWKYVSDHDGLESVKAEIIDARNDGAQHDSLGEVIRSHSGALQEMVDARTSYHGITYDSIGERMDGYDGLLWPRLPVKSIIAPRDNVNLVLSSDDGFTGAEVIRNNSIFRFEHSAYTALENPAWDSLNFSFCISADYLASLDTLDSIFLDLLISGAGDEGDCGHTGESVTVSYYVNSVPHWGATVNAVRKAEIPIGMDTNIIVPEEEIQNVMATGNDLNIVFVGSFMKNDMFADMDKVKITASLVNKYTKGNLPALGRTDSAGTADYAAMATEAVHAETADTAEKAVSAESASTAQMADNFFISKPDNLLNEEGRRYSCGMDTLDVPETSPYTLKGSTQSIISGGYSVTKEDGAFIDPVRYHMTLSSESAQPQNQGYVKHLSGILSWDDFLAPFREGYQYGYICTIEDWEQYPEESLDGAYPQKLLVAYYDDNTMVKLISVNPPVTRKMSDKITMSVWKYTVTAEQLAAIDAAVEAGTFRQSWFGIWNTREYTQEENAEWDVIWYWADYAYTDGSDTDEEMISFFFNKYIYWASLVNHPMLEKKFTALEAAIGGIQESVDAVKDEVDAIKNGDTEDLHITCWGDSLTAGGGWTTTLASLSGAAVHNGGTGGENVRTIAARQGADVMLVDGITIPAECEPVTIAARAEDTGITTQAGWKVTPLLQGGAHVNPVKIGDVEGTLKWTGSSYSDTTGVWTFTRSTAGEEVVIDRPTAIRTAFDRERNGKDEIMIIFMGQNGGYTDVDDLIRTHRLMIDHFKGKEYVILGLSSGTEASRKDYEAAMTDAFGRRFISLREYLAHPIYNENGEIISCYGLADQGLEPNDTYTYNGTTYDALAEIAAGTVPHIILSDSVHYTAGTKTVIGKMLYKKMVEMGIL